jgi:hypothetical protein
LDSSGQPFSDYLEEFGLGPFKRTVLKTADVEYADHLVTHEERHAKHGLDTLLPQDRIRHSGGVDAIQDHRFLRPGDSSGKAHPNRDPYPLADLFLDPTCGPSHEVARVLVQEQDGSGVRVEDVSHPLQ